MGKLTISNGPCSSSQTVQLRHSLYLYMISSHHSTILKNHGISWCPGTVGPAFSNVSAALGTPSVPAASARCAWNSTRRRQRPRWHRRRRENMCLADTAHVGTKLTGTHGFLYGEIISIEAPTIQLIYSELL